MIDCPLNRNQVRRGSELPQSKLNEGVVKQIHEAIEKRSQLDLERKKYTNAALAKKYGVHVRTIDKVSQLESWTHVV